MRRQTSPVPSKPRRGDPINETLMGRIVEFMRSEAAGDGSGMLSSSRLAITVADAEGNYPADPDKHFVFPFKWIVPHPRDEEDRTTADFVKQFTEEAANWKTRQLTDGDDNPDGYVTNLAALITGANAITYLPEGSPVAVTHRGGFFQVFHRNPSVMLKIPTGGIPAESGVVPGYATCELWREAKVDANQATGNRYRRERVTAGGVNVSAVIYNHAPNEVERGDGEGIALADCVDGVPVIATVFC